MASEAYQELGGYVPETPKSKSSRGTRWSGEVPEDWIRLGYELRQKAGLTRINLRLEADKFTDFWAAKSGAGAAKLSWLATWRNWCRSARGVPEAEPPSSKPCAVGDQDARLIAMALKGIRPQSFGPEVVRRGLAKGLLTEEQARRLGY